MQSEIATVIRCFDGRRYFTAKGAAGHEVAIQMKRKYCDCSRGTHVDPSEFWTCDFHRNWNYDDPKSKYTHIAQRLLRWKMFRFKKHKKSK